MICKEYQPISIVEDTEFKKFVFMLNPGYSLPSRKTVTTNLIPQHYIRVYDNIKKNLLTATAVSLTTDTWTSSSSQSFIGITAHFINECGFLTSHLLSCLECPESHTAENLAAKLTACIDEFGLHYKIVAIVSDNAANIRAAVRICGWRNLPCFAHSINLIVQKGVESIKETKTTVKSIIELFKRSIYLHMLN